MSLLHLPDHITRYRCRNALRNRLHGCRVELRLAIRRQQPVGLLLSVRQLRIAEACNCRTIQDGIDQLAVLGQEGITLCDRTVTEPGFAGMWPIANTSKFAQYDWLTCILITRQHH